MVHLPFGSYPGSMPGLYGIDIDHIAEVAMADRSDALDKYLEKWVYSVESHADMLEKRVGAKKLLELRSKETIKEGYHA